MLAPLVLAYHANITRECHFARTSVVLDDGCASVNLGLRCTLENVCVLGKSINDREYLPMVAIEGLKRP